ncbi:AAA family ATPase [Psychrobacillus psychrodurans]|uniref:AAA family ATPase n=1 Tax=Psychrobacillus psychrodurans TaxID=126157 RepID=UPI001F4D68A6|nr:AAA family ATPase [Psychrobacillus psychrodurans]MCK1997038.1 AAA family ATPase [Psychrobacillus psychrodurans]
MKLTDDQKRLLLKATLEKKPRNRIVYGAPGTGKSQQLEREAKLYFAPQNYERITFHPNYSYSHFIGSYKPVVLYKQLDSDITYYKADRATAITMDKEPTIIYEFVPGPFLKMLVRAQLSIQLGEPENFLLIIEEINRANTAATFGDVFQLLDRNAAHNSEYPIFLTEEVQQYLLSVGVSPEFVQNAIIPHNLFIWSTMNSSDQGVNPLDTAFKRRWSFEYLALNKYEHVVDEWELALSFSQQPIKWNHFREKVNTILKEFVPEDKLLGPFFLSRHELRQNTSIKNKLLLYLREDALRMNPKKLFKYGSFYEIAEKYDAGENVFKIDFK